MALVHKLKLGYAHNVPLRFAFVARRIGAVNGQEQLRIPELPRSLAFDQTLVTERLRNLKVAGAPERDFHIRLVVSRLPRADDSFWQRFLRFATYPERYSDE